MGMIQLLTKFILLHWMVCFLISLIISNSELLLISEALVFLRSSLPAHNYRCTVISYNTVSTNQIIVLFTLLVIHETIPKLLGLFLCLYLYRNTNNTTRYPMSSLPDRERRRDLLISRGETITKTSGKKRNC